MGELQSKRQEGWEGSSSCHGIRCNKLSPGRVEMVVDVALACPSCQVKHDDGLNDFTGRGRYGELRGSGW